MSRSSGFAKRFGSKRISKHQPSSDKLIIFQPTPGTTRSADRLVFVMQICLSLSSLAPPCSYFCVCLPVDYLHEDTEHFAKRKTKHFLSAKSTVLRSCPFLCLLVGWGGGGVNICIDHYYYYCINRRIYLKLFKSNQI